MLSSSNSIFDSLPERPPTPPREISEAVDDAISFLDDSNEVDRLTNTSNVAGQLSELPVNASPASSQDTTTNLKKVGFSPYPVYHKIAAVGQLSSPRAKLLKCSPSAKEVRPVKSILKSANVPPPHTPDDLDSKVSYFSPKIPGSFAKMLQSAIKELTGPSRTSRLDAYLALNGALKGYERVPEASEMVPKMDLIMQFLTRDMAWKDANGNLDSNMITQALKLTSSILFDPKLSEALDNDFRTFLIDRSIMILEQQDVPKAIIKMHMNLIAHQRFKAPVMSSTRADKILNALQSIEDRCSGNSIVATRLVIYLRMLEQSPAIMLTRIREWLEHVFHSMLSSINDVRIRAIEICTQAGLVFGQQPHAALALHEMFDTEVEDGQTYCDYLTDRLAQMISEGDTGVYVPQIWSAVVLFFRSRRKPLERWPKFSLWLTLIQKCINASDLTTRYQAMVAWNKLIFAIMPDSSTSKNMMSMLKIPICSGMNKRGSDKDAKQVRQYALDSYHTLLYYTLRPGLSIEEHDEAWNTFVDPVLSQLAKFTGKGRQAACRILRGLFRGSNTIWDPNRALDPSAIKAEELPRLDPRWVRSRLGRMLKLLEPLIATGVSLSSEANALLDETWHCLMDSVADAGSQEVKTSTALKEAIAELVITLRRLWNAFTDSAAQTSQVHRIQQYVSLIDPVVLRIGSGPLTEEILSTTKENGIEVAPTPSHRSSKHYSLPQSPLVLLLEKVLYAPTAFVLDETYEATVTVVLDRLVSAKAAPTSRLEVIYRSLSNLGLPDTDADAVAKEAMWIAFVNSTVKCLGADASLSDGQESQGLGHSLRSGVDILCKGLELPLSDKSHDAFKQLYDTIFDAAKSGAGDGGVVLALIEPVAKPLRSPLPSLSFHGKMRLVTHILETAVWPKTRQSFDQARKALWGVSFAAQKSAIFDPYDNVYNLVVELTTAAYLKIDASAALDLGIALNFFESVIAFLDASPPSLLATSLRKVQDGFALWIKDEARKTASNEDMSNAIRNTWQAIIRILKKIQSKDSTMLKAFEPLLIAGFSSPHRSVVNDTILFWNDTFGIEHQLEYPSKLENVLRTRAVHADISLPSFPDSNEEHVPASLPEFYESQSEVSNDNLGSRLTDFRRQDLVVSASQPVVRGPYFSARKSPFRQSTVSSPITKGVQTSDSATPKARLRHDDSQIQFAPIESSPLVPDDVSQHLTEHQQEVQARQRENAQLFPEFSSSPTAQSTALQRALPKRLDFNPDAARDAGAEAPGTPTGLPDGTGLMSDELPSSPTPSSTKDVGQGNLDVEADLEPEYAHQDPPSSPPRGNENEGQEMQELEDAQATVGPDDITIVTDFGATSTQPENNNEDDEAELEERLATSNGPEHDGFEPGLDDFASDSQLPTMQLQLEQEAADALQPRVTDTSKDSKENDDETQQNDESAEPESAVDEFVEKDQCVFGSQKTENESGSAEVINVSRIENSFIEPEGGDTEKDTHSTSGSQQSSKKRKRRSAPHSGSKRQKKQQSPIKRFITNVFGQGQEDDGDDIGEEIVVASSQRSLPPPEDTASQDASSPAQPANVVTEPVNEPVGSVKEESEAVMPPPKRGPGRPRKSETRTPTPSQSEIVTRASLKRTASTLSNASATDSQVSTSFVKDTPAPAKARKQRKGQDAKESTASEKAAKDLNKGPTTRRTASAVVVLEAESQEAGEHQEPENSGAATPTAQLANEQASPVNDRAIATPRSILARLRNALTDFKGMILGSQEERKFDDVLFELRRETHEAGRRGRQQ